MVATGEGRAISRMAQWLVELAPGEIPAPIGEIARDSLIDTLGVMTAGAVVPVSGHARALAGSCTGPCGLAGTAQRSDARQAAMVNGVAAHALDFDDNCYAGFVHGSAVIVPAALAVAQQVDADGAALLAALVVGAECQYTLGLATGNVLYQRGWWSTGVLGPVGACAAAVRLLQLDAAQAAAALGLAVAGAAGFKACFGSDAKACLAGRAAEAGVAAALLAQAGASGPLDALEHRYGLASLFNDGHFDAGVFDALGRRWTLEDPGLDVKRIPVCLSSHAAVDVVMDLVRQHSIAVDEIAAICCDVPPIVIANLIHDQPHTPQQAQFSMPFAMAAALLLDGPALAHLVPEVIGEPRLRALMARVSMCSDERWDDPVLRAQAPEGACVEIRLHDGRVLQGRRDAARGAAREPLSAAQRDAKFLACLRHAGIDEAQGRQRLAQLETLPSLAQVRTLFPF